MADECKAFTQHTVRCATKPYIKVHGTDMVIHRGRNSHCGSGRHDYGQNTRTVLCGVRTFTWT